jgi:phosphatidylglycerol lysyltransferase
MLLTLVLLVVTLSNILVPFLQQRWQRLSVGDPPIDLNMLGWGQGGWIVASLLLLFIGRAMARGKRQAWFLTVALFTFSLLDTVLEHSHWISIVLTCSVLVLLLIFAPLFSIRSDTGSFIRGYGALAFSGICISGYEAALYLLEQGRVSSLFFTRGDVLMVLRILCFLVLWYGVTAVLRPVHLRSYLQQQDQLQTKTVAHRYGYQALVHFALSADKRHFWSHSGRSFIAYRVVAGIALALGDPIGPQDEHELVLRNFFAFCQQQDWRVVFYQASSQTLLLCQTCGLHSYKIGEEACIDVADFTLQGKRGAAVRHAIARAQRAGVTVHCWHGQQIPEELFADMKRLSSVWMQERKIQVQLGFSMGRFPMDWSSELLTVTALGAGGEVQAFLTWTPMYKGEGWALDVMRRGKETAPGTMEFLIAEAVAWAKAHGYRQMSLGLAPLAGLVRATPSSPSSSFVERSAAYLHQRGVLLGQYRSLYAFKAKFQPRWEERYLIVSERQSLPQVLLALARVHGCGIRYMLRETWNTVRPLKSLAHLYGRARLVKEGKQVS